MECYKLVLTCVQRLLRLLVLLKCKFGGASGKIFPGGMSGQVPGTVRRGEAISLVVDWWAGMVFPRRHRGLF